MIKIPLEMAKEISRELWDLAGWLKKHDRIMGYGTVLSTRQELDRLIAEAEKKPKPTKLTGGPGDGVQLLREAGVEVVDLGAEEGEGERE